MTTKLNEQREKVFLDRYARKNDKGEPVEKLPEQMWDRMSEAISDNKGEQRDFRNILQDFKFVPGGRILAGAGVGTEQTFYNCYVIPVEPKQSTLAAQPKVGKDSREAIFDTIATMVDIMSRGGGVGINWSTLRPSGSYLSRVSGTSSGPVGWMDVASKAVGEVEQGGSRRGAAMFMLDDWHPDILKFVEAKLDYGKITNANVSVAVSDVFMESVKNGWDWTLEFPDTKHPEYNSRWDGDLRGWKEAGLPVISYDTVPASELWSAIVESAHKSGEPGVVFLDRYNQQSTGRDVERIISVNPCGEQGLGAYSVCNLGSMNLAAYVLDNPDRLSDGFDWASFGRDVRTAVRFLDNVIDKSFYWDERSRKRQSDLRRIGLGVMGLADALIRLGIRYGSSDAVNFTQNVFQLMKDEAIEASIELAKEKGPAEAYDEAMWERPYLVEYQKRHKYPKVQPLRNLFFLTQAPTGTTSILAGVNSGIEPYFAFEYTRKDRTGTHKIRVPLYDEVLKGSTGGVEANESVFLSNIGMPEYFVTSNDVSVEEHIAMQAAVQKWVDSSVSKTINGPNSHTVEDVKKAYNLAFDEGLKGLAYFRDGSGRDQVLYKDAPSKEDTQSKVIEKLTEEIALLEETVALGPKAESYRRPEHVSGSTSRLNTSMGTMYLTINRDDSGHPVEIFVNVGKAGSDVMAIGEAVGRLVSMSLQWGIPTNKIASQLVGVGGTSSLSPGLVHAIGRALENAHSSGDGSAIAKAAYPAPVTTNSIAKDTDMRKLCPECGSFSLVREEGCEKCHHCGFSKC